VKTTRSFGHGSLPRRNHPTIHFCDGIVQPSGKALRSVCSRRAIGAWAERFLNVFSLNSNTVAADIWGPLVGPLVAVLSFVCSVRHSPLGAVLWNGGIQLCRVIAFIYADLIVPSNNRYLRRIRWKVTDHRRCFYVCDGRRDLIVEFLVKASGYRNTVRPALSKTSITFNYTTVLNIVLSLWQPFWVFVLTTGGPKNDGPHGLKTRVRRIVLFSAAMTEQISHVMIRRIVSPTVAASFVAR